MMVNGLLCAFLAAVAPVAFGFIAPVHTGSFAAMANGHVAHAPFTTATRAMRKESPVMSMERSYIMVKPDGVQRGIVGAIISRFEQRGYKLAALKLKQADEALLRQHYKDLVDKPFFPKMMEYMISGPVVCMAWEGKDVVRMGRKMLGATNPLESEPGTIRGDFALEECRMFQVGFGLFMEIYYYVEHASHLGGIFQVGRNICHGSDSVENAQREVGLWFDEVDIIDHESAMKDWIYE